MTAAARRPARADPQSEAVEALGLRLAQIAPNSGRVVWRNAAFAQALPNLEVADALPGLARAVAEAQASGAAKAALVPAADHRRVYDARLAPASDGETVYVVLEDAAERQAAQQRHLEDRERLLLTSRVLSVGEMASMLAHELNQPIGSIVNLLRGMKARLNRGALTAETGAAALDKAAEQALYASGVIARVRSFVDQRQPRVEPLDLARLGRATLDLLDWEIQRDGVEGRTDLPADLPSVLGDQVMIQQVLVNLARNALDAMRGVTETPRRLTVAAAALATDEVELSIADTGPGVGEEAAAKLFQPFYSTKADGMGVGLGVCRSIVELHGGRLWFTRNPQRGSTFHVALPSAVAGGGER